jgi:hypothetical protein
MITKLSKSEVRKLDRHRARPCVSVYMALDAVWPGGPSDRARLAALLRKAARALARELDPAAVDRLLLPVVERVREEWSPHGRGIALFRSPELQRGYELPVDVPDLAVVAPSFDTRPLEAYLACPEQIEAERRAVDRYLHLREASQATDAFGEVIEAAAEGRVRVLLRREDAQVWGRIDAERGSFVVRDGRAELQPGDADIIDELCALTLERGGEVVRVSPERMPTELPVAAILRY